VKKSQNKSTSKSKGMSLGAVTANKSDFAKQMFDFGGPSPFEEIIPDE